MKYFSLLIVLGALFILAPTPVSAFSLLKPTVLGVGFDAGSVLYSSKTKERHFGLSYEVGMSSTNDGRIEVLLHPGLQAKVIRYDSLVAWSRYLVYRFRVINEEGNLVDTTPRITLFKQEESAGWEAKGNCLYIDTAQFEYESYAGSFVAYSDKRTDKRYLLFFRSVDHQRVVNALTYSFAVFNGGDRVRRRLLARGLVNPESNEYRQAFNASLKKEMEDSMPGAEWLASPLLKADEEGAIWQQMANERQANEQAAQQAAADAEARRQAEQAAQQAAARLWEYTITVESTVRGWETSRLRLEVTKDGTTFYNAGCESPVVLSLVPGTYHYRVFRGEKVVPGLDRDFAVGPGNATRHIRLKGGQ